MINHQNNFSATIPNGLSVGTTESVLSSVPSVDAPFYLVFDAYNTNGSYETVLVTSKNGNAITHSALVNSHSSGENVVMSFDATELTSLESSLSTTITNLNNSIIKGEISMFAGSVIPSGYLECDGSSISRTTYASLFSVIGTSFGTGDGSTTFGLPNLKGRVCVGLNTGDADFNTVGKTGGANSVNFQHSHQYPHTHVVTGHTSGPNNANLNLDLGGTYGAASASHTHTFSATTSGNSNTTVPTGGVNTSVLNPYITFKFIIKY